MNILELDSYRLADAVKFHNRLNPRLWSSDEHLHPEVRKKLLEIAADFQEFLGIDALEVEDITISGSNAAYSYTPHSDIDLHLVVRKPEMADQVYQELFNAKKYQYNDLHNIRIRGADVELYVQSADETPVSLGEYSIAQDQWLQACAKLDLTSTVSLVWTTLCTKCYALKAIFSDCMTHRPRPVIKNSVYKNASERKIECVMVLAATGLLGLLLVIQVAMVVAMVVVVKVFAKLPHLTV